MIDNNNARAFGLIECISIARKSVNLEEAAGDNVREAIYF